MKIHTKGTLGEQVLGYLLGLANINHKRKLEQITVNTNQIADPDLRQLYLSELVYTDCQIVQTNSRNAVGVWSDPKIYSDLDKAVKGVWLKQGPLPSNRNVIYLPVDWQNHQTHILNQLHSCGPLSILIGDQEGCKWAIEKKGWGEYKDLTLIEQWRTLLGAEHRQGFGDCCMTTAATLLSKSRKGSLSNTSQQVQLCVKHLKNFSFTLK